ncbi:hypothetical protein BH20ACT4_BH20ACT4_00030 [soil metagenome]
MVWMVSAEEFSDPGSACPAFAARLSRLTAVEVTAR